MGTEEDRLDARDRWRRRINAGGVALAGLVLSGAGSGYARMIWRSVDPKTELLAIVTTILVVIPAILFGLRLLWGGLRSAIARDGHG